MLERKGKSSLTCCLIIRKSKVKTFVNTLESKSSSVIEKKVTKGVWGMPWLSEAKKDVISCDKLGGFANRNYIPRFPNGETR